MWPSVWSWVPSLRRLPPNVPQVVLSTNHARAGVPDYEDAVYHPAMTVLKWITAADHSTQVFRNLSFNALSSPGENR